MKTASRKLQNTLKVLNDKQPNTDVKYLSDVLLHLKVFKWLLQSLYTNRLRSETGSYWYEDYPSEIEIWLLTDNQKKKRNLHGFENL